MEKFTTIVGKDGVEQPRAKVKPADSGEIAADEQDLQFKDWPPQQRWQYGLDSLASWTISLPDHWTREFGDWESFEAPSDLITLAEQAAEAWTKIAAKLK